GGKPDMLDLLITFNEFCGLGDPLVFGMPSIESDFGCEIRRSCARLFGRFVDRVFPPQRSGRREAIASLRSRVSGGHAGPGGRAGPPNASRPLPPIEISDTGWAEVAVSLDGAEVAAQGVHGPFWCEGIDGDARVLNCPVFPINCSGELGMTIMAMNKSHGKTTLMPGRSACRLRRMGSEELEVMVDVEHQLELASILKDYDTLPLDRRRVATAKYKAKLRTDEEAKHFDELMAEIEAKRGKFDAPEHDQTSDEHRDLFCQIVRDKKLAHVKMKPGAMGKARQPYTMSKFNGARFSHHIEEQIKDGKLREWTRDDPMPPMVAPAFMADRKGSLLGRMVGDYTCYNKATEDVFWPAPDAESVLQRAMGKGCHTRLSIAFGGTAPAIYQHIQEGTIGSEYKPTGEKLADVFFDDTRVSDWKCAKAGADFTGYAADAEAQASRTWLIETLIEQVVSAMPDGRPFELYLDASDVARAAVLRQRDSPGGAPRVIGAVARSFEDVATRWSAFEREFFAWKEGVAAASKWTEGSVVFTFFDHENIERAESVLRNRRATKQLMAWVAETQDTLANAPRAWIAGKANVLADAGSRAPWQSHVASRLAIPASSARPVRDFIEKLFTYPGDLPQKIEQRRRGMAPLRPPGGRAGMGGAQPAADAPPRQPGGHAGPDEAHQLAAEAPDRPDCRDIPVPSTPSSPTTTETLLPDIPVYMEEHMGRAVAQLRRRDRDLVDIGGTFGKHFLEVGSGHEILTRCVREKGLTVMDPVDKKTGWDLTSRSDMQRLRTMIREERSFGDMVVPSPARARIHATPGFFFVDLDGCRCGMVATAADTLIRKFWRWLTNAVWLWPLAMRCTGGHEHAKVEGRLTTATATYPRQLGVAYAARLAKAPEFMATPRAALAPCRHQKQDAQVTRRSALDGMHLDWPLGATAGELDVSRRAAPMRGAEHYQGADADEIYARQREHLAAQKIPATKVTYKYARDGSEFYTAHFRDPVFDIRDVGGFGRFGVGIAKPTGHRGDARNEFEVRDVDYVSSLATWRPVFATFVPEDVHCWNAIVVHEELVRRHARQFAVWPPRLFGYRAGVFLEPSETTEKLVNLAIRYFWSGENWADQKPITAVTVYRGIEQLDASDCKYTGLLMWELESGIAGEYHVGDAWLQGERRIVSLEPGQRVVFRNANAVVEYPCEDGEAFGDHRETLERLGVPVPSSLRIVGFSGALTALGIDRGKLLTMYKTGPDTRAPAWLLLSLAGLVEGEGSDGSTLPLWRPIGDNALMDEVRHKASLCAYARALSQDKLESLQPHACLTLLDVVVARRPKRCRLPPTGGAKWDDVSFRVTLCWGDDDNLTLEKYEVGGAAATASATSHLDVYSLYGAALFLGPGQSASGGIDYVNITGEPNDIDENALRRLSKRSGLDLKDLHQAHGVLGQYRFYG
ncbi:unnamed protein product, partial [Prorocentrum cordatum]